jgi:hypothetical protein
MFWRAGLQVCLLLAQLLNAMPISIGLAARRSNSWGIKVIADHV